MVLPPAPSATTIVVLLIVDSLNVQNTSCNLMPAGQRARRGDTRMTLVKNASWRKGVNGDSGWRQPGPSRRRRPGKRRQRPGRPDPRPARSRPAPQRQPGRQHLVGNTRRRRRLRPFTGDTKTYSGRDAFYAKLKRSPTPAYKTTLAGKLTLAPSTVDLAGAGRTDYFAYAALASLSPFVFKPVSRHRRYGYERCFRRQLQRVAGRPRCRGKRQVRRSPSPTSG
jgi:hypothetical protein